MYGLLIENLASFIKIQWGEGKWDSVRKHAGVDAPSFSIHHVYAETLLSRLAKSACTILGVDERQFFEAMGVYFVEFVGVYGYDKMLSVLGRHLRDFLNGLDNLHEYLKFSYTKMKAPSFYCSDESATGLRLHYRSKRRGFVWYTIGQIKQVAKHFYDQDIEIELISEVLDGETMHNIFQMKFDNIAYVEHDNLRTIMKKEAQLPIRASIIFELFPFCIVFSTEMVITYTGHALLTIFKGDLELVGQGMTEAFEIIRPLIAFSFQTILERSNNIFELITTSPIKEESLDAIMEDETIEGVHLKLRGQMLFMDEWNMIIFLANPVMPDLASLVGAGIFINDLSLHDCSRDLVLAGTQQSVELKLALDQEQHKSKKLEESMKKLDDEMKKTDELLYQMIPKKVADRLRKGENPAQTCEVFEQVSILFSDVVTFTDICSKITPIQVVGMLNHMYSLFDQLTERNGVYKVETIGDSYMVVGGAPVKDTSHAERIADMAMDMIDASKAIKDPTREGEHLKLRVGVHSGMVVAGIVGVKMPRYCLFGDTVNTSSRMESTSEANRIQISEVCMSLLPPTYKHELRGTVNVKGKGEMSTYWLSGREARVPLSKMIAGSFDWSDPSAPEQQPQSKRKYSKTSDKGSRKSSVISNPDPIESTKSRGEEAAPASKVPPPTVTVTKVEQTPSTSKSAEATQLPKSQPPPPKIVEPTPDAPTKTNPTGRRPSISITRPSPPLQSQKSTEDATGTKMELNVAGKDLYRSGRRLSEALRSRSPSPASRGKQNPPSDKLQAQSSSKQDPTGSQINLNDAGKDLQKSARRLSEAIRSRSPSPTPSPQERGRPTDTKISATSTTSTAEKRAVGILRQATLVELPDKLAEVMDKAPDQVKIVKVPSKNVTLPGDLKKEEDIICIVPVDNSAPNNGNIEDVANGNNNEGGGETGDQERESFLINVKMKKGEGNGLKKTIDGIRVGISRLPKNEALRKRIKENKIAVVTTDVLTDLGCVAFADKQRQVMSQACSIL